MPKPPICELLNLDQRKLPAEVFDRISDRAGRLKEREERARKAWESFGTAFGVILVNEMDGMEWVTVIDGQKEFPALRFRDSKVMVNPISLIWDKAKSGQPCDLKAEFERIKNEVEAAMD